MKLAILIAFLVGLLWLTYRVVTRYRAAKGTKWERLLATAKGSATLLWHGIVAVSGMLVTVVLYAAEYLNMPEVKDFIVRHIDKEYVGLVLVLIAIIGGLARLRSL